MDFLEQLSAALPSSSEVEDVLCGKLKNTRKLELRLIDRRKISNDGYTVSLSCLCLLSHGSRVFGTRTLSFPKGVRASIKPFGRAGSNAFQTYSDLLAQFFRIADLAHEAIVDGLPATKRYIYMVTFFIYYQFSLSETSFTGMSSSSRSNALWTGLVTYNSFPIQ